MFLPISWLQDGTSVHEINMLRPTAIALWCAVVLAPIHAVADAPVVVVQPGDALSLIAERAGVSVAQIKEWNGLKSDLIRAGQELVVGPTAASSPNDEIDWTPPFDYGTSPSTTLEKHSAPIAAREASVAVATTQESKKDRRKSRTYRVKSGDTLTGIALKLDTSVAEILEMNPDLNPDRIYPGDTIDIGEPRPEVTLTLERGDTLLAVAERYGVNRRDLARWNSSVRQGRARPGIDIRLYTRIPVSPSEAIGPTNHGRLENGVLLPRHPGYVIRTKNRAYGTEETTRWIVDAFNAVDAKFKTRKVVRIHDISDRNGGKIRDHKSHQNGRDADIGYYHDECPRSGCGFERLRASELDVARQWALLQHWLKNDQAEMIFIDYRLQAKLYRYAKRKGVPETQLNRWIQYPRGKYEPVGVIRHFRNHDDHLHVRFVCPYSDVRCRR
ncbi:MAG: penicillin-insensitive murein endopeptidase [Myxococcales bacterium]|nr:penicillin-insensitive murein endopeptidase [Myxococcales bacterium]MDH3483139.1 penicillin-insensitive murein endopeptidase [Myxococcales bacterium]